jgi:hypothetical protein
MKTFLRENRTQTKVANDYLSKTLMAKILFYSRLIGVSDGDVLFYGQSLLLKFVIFMATLLKPNRKLYITENITEAKRLILIENIKTVFIDHAHGTGIEKVFKSYYVHFNNIDGMFSLYENLMITENVMAKETYQTIAYNKRREDEYHALSETILDRMDFLHLLDGFKKRHQLAVELDEPVLSFTVMGKEYLYSFNNIVQMIYAIDKEFNKLQRHLIDFSGTKFEDSFAYMAYFFLRGDRINTGNRMMSEYLSHDLEDKKQIPPKKVFVSDNVFLDTYHHSLKYKLFSKLNRFLVNFWLTKWLLKIIHTQQIRDTFKLYSKKDELVVIGQTNPHYILNKFFENSRIKFSVIFGTYADGHTLAINRYDDKALSLVKEGGNQYRLMSEIKIGVDTLCRLYLGGNRIHDALKNRLPVFNKEKDQKFYLTPIYAEVDEDVITVYGEQIDVYFDHDKKPVILSAKVQAFKSLPFVQDCVIVKHNQTWRTEGDKPFVAVVKLDNDYIEQEFVVTAQNLTSLQLEFDKMRHAINKTSASGERIANVVVSNKFFNVIENYRSFGSTEEFIRMLDHKPFCYESEI